jgi:hypothetical protein
MAEPSVPSAAVNVLPIAPPEVAWLAIGLGVLLVAGAVTLGARSRLLRDDSGRPDAPFSFARAQLLWWTVIIGVAFLMCFGTWGVMPPINSTCLALLGIGAGTTAAAKIIDERQRSEAREHGLAPVNSNVKSAWFLEDILSDEKGVSVHRFQALFFNIAYGVAYLVNVHRGIADAIADAKKSLALPDYNVETWALLGLSSAGYLSLKVLENKTPVAPPGSNDELIDSDAQPTRSGAVG